MGTLITLQGTNISHLGKRKISFQSASKMGYVSSQVNDELRNVERCIGFWDPPKDVKQRACHSLAAIILDKINGLKSHQHTWTQTPTIPEKKSSQKSQEVRVEFQISIHIISCEVIIPVDFPCHPAMLIPMSEKQQHPRWGNGAEIRRERPWDS